MLAIHKRHTRIKAITAGALSFAIGLTSVAAFVGNQYEGTNVVFNKEKASSGQALGSSDQKNTSGQATVSDESVQGASPSTTPAPGSVTPQTSGWSGSTVSPQPLVSTSPSGATAAQGAPAAPAVTSPVNPTQTPAPLPTPEPVCTLDLQLLGACILP